MNRSRLSSGKFLVHRNLIQLSVEINFSMYMLNLSNLLLLVYAQLNSGTFIVSRISCVGYSVKI